MIANATAGAGTSGRLLPEVIDAMDDSGLEWSMRRTHRERHATLLAAEAFKRGDLVVACGGDGTIHEVAQAAVEADGLMGIIPVGTGNDFARFLGFPLDDITAAVSILKAGSERRVDVGEANSEIFCCIVSIGLDADANDFAHRTSWLSGDSQYLVAGLRQVAVGSPREFHIEVDGDTTTERAWMINIANAGAYGGGMHLIPEADVTDGQLNLLSVAPISRLGLLGLMPKIYRGTHTTHSAYRTRIGRRIHVAEVSGQSLSVYADGERITSTPVDIRVRPGALRLLMPPSDLTS
ncbi:MAG: diacylglycerol kinase family lipid kinase [Acidimicrobiia bacterium]|nr:diacylglycerol kinase family lipid kinase [Acidimicrobiia bacterium]